MSAQNDTSSPDTRIRVLLIARRATYSFGHFSKNRRTPSPCNVPTPQSHETETISAATAMNYELFFCGDGFANRHRDVRGRRATLIRYYRSNHEYKILTTAKDSVTKSSKMPFFNIASFTFSFMTSDR